MFAIRRLLDALRGPGRAEFAGLSRRVKNLEVALDAAIDDRPWTPSDEMGFNGQIGRKRLFQQIVDAFAFDAIVETGTWLGNTAGYVASVSTLPLYTCELNRHFFALARRRLQAFPGISFSLDDSRSFLRRLAQSDLAAKNLFFYLDAHFYDDLPLAGELGFIAGAWPAFVIMVDDFAVPGDAGYGYDDYGRGKQLTLDTFRPVLAKYDLVPLFPALPSDQETGARRGCVVLARSGEWADRLALLPLLRPPS